MLSEVTCWEMISRYTAKRASYKLQARNNWMLGFWNMYYDTRKQALHEEAKGQEAGAAHLAAPQPDAGSGAAGRAATAMVWGHAGPPRVAGDATGLPIHVAEVTIRGRRRGTEGASTN